MPWTWPAADLCGDCAKKQAGKEPKACPFCGITGAVWGVQENDGSNFWIQCAVCHAQGPKVDLQELAMPAWNRRNEPITPTP